MGIIILDTGVSKYLKDVKTINIGQGICDDNGHGTQLINVIRHINPKAQVTSLKILDNNNMCDLELLLKALRECLDIPDRVICLCLAVEANIWIPELDIILSELRSQGKKIVSSYHNNLLESLPASSKNVIGIGRLEDSKYFSRVSNGEKIQVLVKPQVIFIKDHKKHYAKMTGNSLSCALVAAVIDKQMLQSKVFQMDESILEFLRDENLSYYFTLSQINIEPSKCTEIEGKIKTILANNNIHFQSNDKLYYQISRINMNNILTSIENENFNINKYSFLCLEYLNSVESFVDYIYSENGCD